MGNTIFSSCCIQSATLKKCPSDLTRTDTLPKQREDGPLTEIQVHHFITNNIQSLSRVPIRPKNVIRKIDGSPYTFYEKLTLLGYGAYGQVFKVLHKETNQIRSMKVISKTQLKQNYTVEEIENEIDILKRVSHPNIIKLYEFYSDENDYYLINEFCNEGDLCKHCLSMKKLPELVVQKIMFDIFTAVSYLHMNHIIHGDLKLENVMIDCNDQILVDKEKNTSQFFEAIKVDVESEHEECGINLLKNLRKIDIKLIDFGCSKIFTKKNQNFKDEIGTLYYLAPEVLNNHYNEKCDIWSCGVIMYILLSGEIPFKGATEVEIEEKIKKGRYCFYNYLFKNISFEAKDLMRQCFIYNPEKRITAKEALNHPFFKKGISHYLNNNKSIYSNSRTKQVLSSLISFSNKSKFFQAVLTYLTHNFVTKEELTSLKNVFMAIDTDIDGKISQAELKECLKQLEISVTEDQIKNIFKSVDFDNDGFIDYPEFIQATISKKDLFTEDNLRAAFKLFDTKSDGTVSVKELEEILGVDNKEVNKDVISQLLKEINKTEDDEFTFEEFKGIIMECLNNETQD